MEASINKLDQLDTDEDMLQVDDAALIRPFLQAQIQVHKYLEDTIFKGFLLSDQYRRYISHRIFFFFFAGAKDEQLSLFPISHYFHFAHLLI